MTQKDLQTEARELKDSIAQDILKFRGATGIIPNVDIKIIQQHQSGLEVLIRIDVIVNVEL